jgi:hypothetical protein
MLAFVVASGAGALLVGLGCVCDWADDRPAGSVLRLFGVVTIALSILATIWAVSPTGLHNNDDIRPAQAAARTAWWQRN